MTTDGQGSEARAGAPREHPAKEIQFGPERAEACSGRIGPASPELRTP